MDSSKATHRCEQTDPLSPMVPIAQFKRDTNGMKDVLDRPVPNRSGNSIWKGNSGAFDLAIALGHRAWPVPKQQSSFVISPSRLFLVLVLEMVVSRWIQISESVTVLQDKNFYCYNVHQPLGTNEDFRKLTKIWCGFSNKWCGFLSLRRKGTPAPLNLK